MKLKIMEILSPNQTIEMLGKSTKCSQCGKYLEKEEIINDKILKNHNWITLPFCSKQCASHYQMGCEG